MNIILSNYLDLIKYDKKMIKYDDLFCKADKIDNIVPHIELTQFALT